MSIYDDILANSFSGDCPSIKQAWVDDKGLEIK